MTYRDATRQRCNCRCPLHHGDTRVAFTDRRCHCLATRPTQPLTLLANEADCMFFLDVHGRLWHVPALQPGHWDWGSAARLCRDQARFDVDLYQTGIELQTLLRRVASQLGEQFDRD